MHIADPIGKKLVQKGLACILRERKLWPAAGLSKAEATALLDVQPDFASQKSWLEEELAQRGHLIDFYPKYYCELNFIERIWALAKQVIRADSDFTWNGLQAKVPATLELMAQIIQMW